MSGGGRGRTGEREGCEEEGAVLLPHVLEIISGLGHNPLIPLEPSAHIEHGNFQGR